MKTEKTIVDYRCDWCGSEMNRPFNNVSFVHSWACHDGSHNQHINLGGSLYYGSTSPDYCKECAIKALTRAIEILKSTQL